MDKDGYKVTKKLPVLIGEGRHVMATADIYRSPGQVLIQIIQTGPESQLLADFLEQAAPIALSFDAIPVRNITEKRENI
jgi:hypothetical protein